ncbi:MAG: hypothetical protein Q9184_002456 [Pyrenodesmia sp. 2 TL-2023]
MDYFSPHVPNLGKFAFDSMDDMSVDSEWLSHMLFEHSNTLRYLSLGTESRAVLDYHDTEDTSYRTMDDVLTWMVEQLEDLAEDVRGLHLANTPLLYLDTLELKGLNASKLIKAGFHFLDWKCLKSLVLESCHGLEQALALLADTKNVQGQPLRSDLRLVTFRVRCEGLNLVTQLNHFLAAITGLVNLSVLLESPDSSRNLDFITVLKSHGKSLETLVWEERTGRRESFVGSRNEKLPTFQQLQVIAENCPNLIELGLPMNWIAFDGSWARDVSVSINDIGD